MLVGGVPRPALVLQPVGSLLPLDIDPQELVNYVRALVKIVDALSTAGFLHRDLSYFNLLIYSNLPLVADFQTLLSKDVGSVLKSCLLAQSVKILRGILST